MSERMSSSSDVGRNSEEAINEVGNAMIELLNMNLENGSKSSGFGHFNSVAPGSGLNLSSSNPRLSNQSNGRNSRTNRIFLPDWEELVQYNSQTTTSYTFISYNVLAQAHLLANKYLYKKNRRHHLQWETRFIKLTNFFEKYPADIYCLQEVEKAHISQYASYFNHASMNYIYENRPGGKPDGCLIAYNPVAFTMLDEYKVDYSEENPMGNVSDNVGQIVVLKVNAKHCPDSRKDEENGISDRSKSPNSEKVLIVVNTHIVYSPKNGHVKLWQIIKLLDQIRQVKELYKDWTQSIVFSGDFNAVAHSGLWALIVDGKIDTGRYTKASFSNQKKAKSSIVLTESLPRRPLPLQAEHSKSIFEHSLNFQPVYKKSDIHGFYTQTDSNGLVVDHIFYTGVMPLSRLGLWSLTDFRPDQLPGDVYGSDHMPVGFQFELLEAGKSSGK